MFKVWSQQSLFNHFIESVLIKSQTQKL